MFHLRARRGAPNDAVYRLAAEAAVLDTDDFPGYLARDHNRRLPTRLGIPYYSVDSSCIVPMSCIEKQEYAARTIRPKIHKLLPGYLEAAPAVRLRHRFDAGRLPVPHTHVTPANAAALAADCEIDASVPASTKFRGGRVEARRRLKLFLKQGLRRYAARSREPSANATSRLSPYLHFGHISALEVAMAVRDYAAANGLIVDEFFEQLTVRRELAFNFARYGGSPNTLAALPGWAQRTLAKHKRDRRASVYGRDQFERAQTHDALWNATQNELLREGAIHGYYRMYWGKKILEWSAAPQDALDTMIYLNDRYALDGRDPNGYTNILWCLGLHDRPWAERPVFGTIRSMTLQGMRRKTDVDAYVQEFS